MKYYVLGKTCKSILLFYLTLSALGVLDAGDKIFLNPSAQIGIFRQSNGLWYGAASHLELRYSERELVLDAVLTVPQGQTFRSKGKAGDEMSVFSGDVFEIQIAPAGQNGVYYHFGICPTGFMYTARCRDAKWEPRQTVLENQLDGGRWHFRLHVPYHDLNAAPPRRGEVWRINLARSDVSSGAACVESSYSGASDYHDPAQYSEVIFGEDAPAKTSIVLRDLKSNTDLLQLDFASLIPKPIALRLEFYSEGRLCCAKDAVMHNGSLSVQVPLPLRKIPLKSRLRAEIMLKNAENGKVLCHSRGIFQIPAEMLQLDKFYYTPSDSMIRFRHKFSGRVAVRLYDSGGKLLRTVFDDNAISLVGLSPGRYVLEAANGRSSTSRVLFVLDGPPALGALAAGQALTASDGRLCRDGKPVYLIGLSATQKSFPQFPDAFNLSLNRSAVRRNSVTLNMLPGGKEIRKPFLARVFPPEQVFLEKVSDQVRKVRPHDGPSLWRISYEAQIPLAEKNASGDLIRVDSKDLMHKIFQAVKKANPELIYSIHTDRSSRVNDFSTACDVLEVAYWSSSFAQEMMPNLQRDMLQLKQDVAPDKPIVFWLGGTIPDKECRLAEEIRAAVYLSVLHGFTGNIIHMGHGFLPPERSRLWSLLSGIHAEIESFYDEWAAGKEFPVKIPAPFIGKAVRSPSGNTLLMVINPTPNEILFSCGLPGIPPNDLFTGFEPKLYRLSER